MSELEGLLARTPGVSTAEDDAGLQAIRAAVQLLNEDLRRHLVEENELLFPRVLELAASLDDS